MFVVVGLTDGDCAGYAGHDCVSWVHGPFAHADEAKEYAAKVPQGFRPHVLPFDAPLPEP